MSWKEQLASLRAEIDETDAALVALFRKRMETAKKIANIKQENNLMVQDDSRENQVVENATALVDDGLKTETALLMRTLMSLSREYQHKLLFKGEAPVLPPPRAPITQNVICAYQGVPGAWSEQAAASLFPTAEQRAVARFEDVFIAVKEETAHYGIVPLENSKTGAIGETYDLLRKYGCYIVGRTWVSIRQCLLGAPGSSAAAVREVLSHPQGFKQCSRFLQGKNWEQTACRNTAAAAEKVAKAQDPKLAAIASRRAGALYGLDVLAPDIMDAADNRTSFVVIAKAPEYDADSDLISVTFSTQHRSGALCEALLPFMADGLNLMRIESRPAAAGKYRFFAEVQGSILDENTTSALRQASAASEYFEVLGCYKRTESKEPE